MLDVRLAFSEEKEILSEEEQIRQIRSQLQLSKSGTSNTSKSDTLPPAKDKPDRNVSQSVSGRQSRAVISSPAIQTRKEMSKDPQHSQPKTRSHTKSILLS